MAEQSQLSLTHEAVEGVCKKVLDEVIGLRNYVYSESGNWTKLATEKITRALVSLKSNSKFCVCLCTMQNNLGSGLSVSSTCYWNKATDAAFSTRWESDTLVVICNVFALVVPSPEVG